MFLLWLVMPLFLYWISRMWFLARHKILLDDPVLFAAKDRVTYGLLQRVQHTNPELVDEWLPTMSEGARRKFVAEHRK